MSITLERANAHHGTGLDVQCWLDMMPGALSRQQVQAVLRAVGDPTTIWQPTGNATAQIELVTPEQAAYWLEHNLYREQRHLYPDRVAQLADAILANEFALTAIQFRRWEGHDYLIDAQHRLNAIVRARKAAELIVARKEVASYAEIGEEYGRLDIGKARTPGEVMTALALSDAMGLKPDELTRLWAAIKVLMVGFRGTSASSTSGMNGWEVRVRSRIMRGMMEWHPEARAYFAAIAKASASWKTRLSNAGVLAVGLVSFREQPERAQVFWRLVAEKVGYEGDTGPYHLVDFLGGGKTSRINYAARRTANCWNLFLRKKDGSAKVQKVTVRDLHEPITIAGTRRYTGEEVVRLRFLPAGEEVTPDDDLE